MVWYFLCWITPSSILRPTRHFRLRPALELFYIFYEKDFFGHLSCFSTIDRNGLIYTEDGWLSIELILFRFPGRLPGNVFLRFLFHVAIFLDRVRNGKSSLINEMFPTTSVDLEIESPAWVVLTLKQTLLLRLKLRYTGITTFHSPTYKTTLLLRLSPSFIERNHKLQSPKTPHRLAWKQRC